MTAVFGMQQFIAQMNIYANMTLHPQQAMLTYGDTWARFLDVPQRIVEFGRIFTEDEVRKMVNSDDELNVVQKREAIANLATALEHGYMYGIATSIYGQEFGVTHKAHVWPVEKRLYREALTVGCRADALSLPGKINLEAAFRAWRGAKR